MSAPEVRECPACHQPSGTDARALAGYLQYSSDECIYCLCRQGIEPRDLFRAAEYGRKSSREKETSR